MSQQEIHTVHAHPARVRRIATDARRADLLRLAKESHAFDATIFDEQAPFFWEAEISSDRLDAYFTHMALSSLQNYAGEAKAGVSFQNSHNWRELPLGRSLTGTLAQDEVSRVLADFFTVAGLRLNGISTDDFIGGVRAGIIHDVSIGFYGGREICDLCGNRYYSWDCPHIAGLQYEIEKDGVVSRQLATVTIEDAHLAEVSAVFDGATPGAAILKAEQRAGEGLLAEEEVRILEHRYRVKLPVARHNWPGHNERSKGVGNTNGDGTAQDGVTGVLRNVLDKYKIGEGKRMEEAIELLDIELDHLRAIQEKSGELEAAAADGRQYRSDLLAEALAEGVRAYGQEFDQATYRATLEAAPLATVKRMRDDWARVGDTRLPAGRGSQDSGDAPGASGDTRRKPTLVPDSAYVA